MKSRTYSGNRVTTDMIRQWLREGRKVIARTDKGFKEFYCASNGVVFHYTQGNGFDTSDSEVVVTPAPSRIKSVWQ